MTFALMKLLIAATGSQRFFELLEISKGSRITCTHSRRLETSLCYWILRDDRPARWRRSPALNVFHAARRKKQVWFDRRLRGSNINVTRLVNIFNDYRPISKSLLFLNEEHAVKPSTHASLCFIGRWPNNISMRSRPRGSVNHGELAWPLTTGNASRRRLCNCFWISERGQVLSGRTKRGALHDSYLTG